MKIYILTIKLLRDDGTLAESTLSEGEITFITFLYFMQLAKGSTDKKTISETDLKKLLSNAQKIPLSALFLHNGKLSKKAIEFAQTYSSVLKIKKIQTIT